MSSTRRTDSDTINQERWCSASEYTDGTINALMVAKRIFLVQDKNLKELLWFIQWRSLCPGGIDAFSRELLESFPDRIGTPLLREWQSSPDRPLSECDVKSICSEFAHDVLPERIHHLVKRFCPSEDMLFAPDALKALPQPRTHQFVAALTDSLTDFSRDLVCLCVEPSAIDASTSPWYFKDLFGAIRIIRAREIEEANNRLADTSITRQMREALDFCYRRRRMVFIEGAAGIGRSATLKAWSDAHAGMVRYVETPSSNDDRTFYAKLAEALGVARGTSYNGQQIKLRVEETLRASGLVIALDESQYLWPQYNRPRSLPSRLLWVKTAFDGGTPFAVVAHTDFSKWQKLYVAKTMWTDEQWERRLNRKVFLPAQHTPEDMMLIAQAKLPNGDEASWVLLSGYALQAEKQQASAITELLESARDRAELAGREEVTFEDIEAAMHHDHLPSEDSAPGASTVTPSQKRIIPVTQVDSSESPRTLPSSARQFVHPSPRTPRGGLANPSPMLPK
jgi:hypothetical protein